MPYIRNEDGTSSPAVPLGWQGGLDVEVSHENGRHRWCIYDEAALVATGLARTRLGLAFAVRHAYWKAGRS